MQKQSVERPQGKRGIALLIAMMTIMIMISLASDMIISRTVQSEMAMTMRDRIKAEYAAKSGINLGLFFASISWAWSLFQTQPGSPIKQPLTDDDSSPWNLVNDFPPMGKTLVEMVKSAKSSANVNTKTNDVFNLGSVFSDKLIDKMILFEDSFTIKISDEAKRINLNACYDKRCQDTVQQLSFLFSCPAEKMFLESQNVNPEQLAFRIKDFINNSSAASPESGFSEKDAPYERYNPPYKAKRLPFDTIDELKLVEGWNDAIHKVFADYLTVYPFPTENQFAPKININTVDVGVLGCLVPSARDPQCSNTFFLTMNKLKKKSQPVAGSGVGEFLKQTACLGDNNVDPRGGKINTAEWFDTRSLALRIQAFGDTGNQRQTVTMVIRRIFPKEKVFGVDKNSPKRSYQILFWKMT